MLVGANWGRCMTLFQAMIRGVALIALLGAVSACTPRPAGHTGEVFDPHEATNRDVHTLNKALDQAIIRPLGVGYAGATEGPVGTGVSNFATNLGEPANLLNHTLQGNVEGAATAFARFFINTMFGLGGLFDVAGDSGLAEHETDFGETMHVWGVGEGAFVELPVFGPSTERDAVGIIVDMVIDPVGAVSSARTARIGTGIKLVDKVGGRGRFADTVDSILYDSADSYAQARLIYLQNRRFELGGDRAGLYSDPYTDPYDDPYADPYSE